MFRHVYWKFDANPLVVNKGESRLGKLVAYLTDHWHVTSNLYKLAKAGEKNGYFHPTLDAKSCLHVTSDGSFEFRAYIDEDHDEEAQLVMTAMIGFVEESPNFRTVTYHFTEVEL